MYSVCSSLVSACKFKLFVLLLFFVFRPVHFSHETLNRWSPVKLLFQGWERSSSLADEAGWQYWRLHRYYFCWSYKILPCSFYIKVIRYFLAFYLTSPGLTDRVTENDFQWMDGSGFNLYRDFSKWFYSHGSVRRIFTCTAFQMLFSVFLAFLGISCCTSAVYQCCISMLFLSSF